MIYLSELLILIVGLAFAAADMAGIYYLSKWSLLLGSILFGFSSFIWMCLRPHKYNNDPAGNGLESGFRGLIHIAISTLISILLYVLLKTSSSQDSILQAFLLILSVYALIVVIWLSIESIKSELKEQERKKEKASEEKPLLMPDRKRKKKKKR